MRLLLELDILEVVTGAHVVRSAAPNAVVGEGGGVGHIHLAVVRDSGHVDAGLRVEGRVLSVLTA